ncbi:MAG TPA: hypothetical protein VF668_23320 [Pyrinomonadaceae bacterium]
MGHESPWHSPAAPFTPRQHAIKPCGFMTASAGSAPDRTQHSSAAARNGLTMAGHVLRAACRVRRKGGASSGC